MWMNGLSSQLTVLWVVHDGTDSSDFHSEISTGCLDRCDRKRKTYEASSKMAPTLQGAELTPSYEQNQIYIYIGSSYSCATTECWMNSF